MDFYRSISEYYDLIFTTGPETVEFLNNRIEPQSGVLDLACGTGNYAIALARLGHRVLGIDRDGAMIARAREKAAGVEVDFKVGDMLGLKDVAVAGFDLIFCIGNSLVHLESEEEIGRLIRDCHELLAERGLFIAQIVNYDRIMEKRIVELPRIRREEEGLVFTRRYDYQADSRTVLFKTELAVREGERERRIENSIPLLILKKAALIKLAEQAGFKDLHLFGSFAGKAHDTDSFATILTCRRA